MGVRRSYLFEYFLILLANFAVISSKDGALDEEH